MIRLQILSLLILCVRSEIDETLSTPTTFNVSPVKAELVSFFEKPANISLDIGGADRHYELNVGTKFPTLSIKTSTNGFVRTVILAYNEHHNLVIRPDDVWIAIAVQFSFYINAHAEEFRGKFVNFEGKKKLSVVSKDRPQSANYHDLMSKMAEEIDKNIIDKEIKEWITPNFTTTTPDDRLVGSAVLMSSLKTFFDYELQFMCGIPKITLEGSVEDWKTIKKRLKQLESYGLVKWTDMLEPILDQFIAAKLGHADKEFWRRIVSYKLDGSGPAQISLGGWISAFCVYSDDGKWHGTLSGKEDWPFLLISNIPSGIVLVDVIIDDNGHKYNSTLIAGHLASEVLPDGYTLKANIGWSLLSTIPKEVSSSMSSFTPRYEFGMPPDGCYENRRFVNRFFAEDKLSKASGEDKFIPNTLTLMLPKIILMNQFTKVMNLI